LQKKKVKEEKHKKYEEARNNDTTPMDTDILEISIVGTSRHAQFGGIGLGICTPFKESEVPNLNKFTCYKAIGRIVQAKIRKFMVLINWVGCH
jgi:hypothetical protein